jgi:ATP-dependent RNA helicase SUPV3L1/SUV3
MVDAESTQGNDALASAPVAPIPDWSNVRGFQVLAAAGPESDASAADPTASAELGKELTARAARFSQSVDDSIVLASDGLIRWLGDPVARLIAGEELLKPRAVLLADEALSAESREAVEARLALWIKAHVSKVLGPLEALAEPGAAVVEPVRALANRIAQSLGVLERERVRQQVKTLDQSARSTLRKLGVRFGSMYIFVPALLKPGARTLCSQLWGLRRGEAGAERLLTFAAAGRTSFAAEAPLAADTYRVAGFRLCGDRVVRIDIVERLNDLIRAAIPDHLRPGGMPPSEASGFVVSPQMTSLTGCSGESFASILRSLGYESHRVKKSEFEAATRKHIASMNPIEAPPATVAEAGDADSVAAETAPGSDIAVASTESIEGDFANAIEAVEPTPSAEPEPDLGEAAPTAPIQPAEMQEAPTVSETAPVEALETPHVEPLDQGETPAVESLDQRETPAIESPEQGETPPVESLYQGETPAIESLDKGETPPVESLDQGETPAVESPDQGETPVVEGAEAGAEPPPTEDEWIEVWRPAPRRRPQPAARSIPTAPSGGGEAARPPGQARDRRRHWPRDTASRPEASTQDAAAETSAPVAGETPAPAANEGPREASRRDGGAPHRHERGRGRPHKGSRAEEAKASEPARGAKDAANASVKKEHRPQPVDMDSPFAKLLALKPLLERRDKRT